MGPLIFIFLLLALVVPAAAIAILFRRSPHPARFRYRMMRVTAPLMILLCSVISVGNYLQRGFQWSQFFGVVVILTQGLLLWRELPKLRHAALDETPRQGKPSTWHRPRLLWPFAAIIGLMLLLAVMAAWTLKADRRSVEQEARTRATELAAALLTVAEKSLNIVEFGTNGPVSFSVTHGRDFFIVNERFQLTSPQPWKWPPQPAPLEAQDFSNLKPEKLALWREAENSFERRDWTNAAEGYLKFLENRVRLGRQPMSDFHAGIFSSRFRSIALFKRAVAFEKLGRTNDAVSAYNDIFDGFTIGGTDTGESGLSLRHLAALKILDLTAGKPGSLPSEWHEHPLWLVSMVSYLPPSPIAEQLIRRLKTNADFIAAIPPNSGGMEQAFELWERANRGRQVYAEAAAQMTDATNDWPGVFWVNWPSGWLAVRQIPPTNHTTTFQTERLYAAIPQAWLRVELDRPFISGFKASPFVARVQIAGEPIIFAHAQSMNHPLAGTTIFADLSSDKLPVRVSVSLKDPGLYFASVRRRQFMFGALVVVAVLAGFAAAWILRRSLLKQLSLNEQKSNFVSSVSHELRAPIASVRLMAESLERGNVTEPAKQREYFRFIGQECRRLSALIANVLDFARIEQGRKQYEFEPTDLAKLVATTVKLMEPYATERGVKLALRGESQGNGCQGNEDGKPEALSPHSPDKHSPDFNLELSLDGHAIQQALVNLIDNAIKHSAAGQTVTVSLETRNAERGVRNVGSETCNLQPSTFNLSVSDHGPGIPASEHAKIFERFHRLGSELRRETPGVGIGLSIVKHIVEAHGGRVIVESKVGQGSRFTIELPGKTNHE